MTTDHEQPRVDVQVDAGAYQREGEALLGGLHASLTRALAFALPGVGDGREVSLLLCDDARIRPLNRDFLGKDRPTDVLSFPSGEAEFLGDVAISLETARARIDPGTWGLDDEVLFLWIHGVLHLLGHDHHEPIERERMEAEEQRVWTALGRTGTLRGPSEEP